MVLFTLFEFLISGPKGQFGFNTEVTRKFVEGDVKKLSKPEDFVGHVLDLLRDYGLFTHRFKTMKPALVVEELNIRLVPGEGTPYPVVSFNMAKFARLPGIDPAAELQELYDLFASFKPLFATYPGAFPSISIQNDHDDEGRTYGTLHVGMRDATDEEEAAANVAADEAMRRIAASPVLSDWLQQLALDLDTIGPYSWFQLSSENFFEFDEDPVNEYLRSNPAPRKPKTEKRKHEPFYLRAGQRGRAHTGKKHNFFL